MKRLEAEETKIKGMNMSRLCQLFGKSFQAYYQHGDSLSKQMMTETMVVKFVKEIRALDPGMGPEKLHLLYQRRFGKDFEYMVGRDKMAEIISKYGLTLRKTRRKPNTTDSMHGLPTYPNLVKDVIPVKKNRIWVADITYIPIWLNMRSGKYYFCYLSLLTDYYTKEIIGWSVGESLGTRYCLEALEMALERLCEEDNICLIHHSDRGVQYASAPYVNMLREAGIQISMTECGDPKDNAVAERVNGIIKNELLKDFAFFSIEDVRRAVSRAVDFYNNERPHMSLNYMTPSQAAKQDGRIAKRWVSYREKYLDSLHIEEGVTIFAQQTLDFIEQG